VTSHRRFPKAAILVGALLATFTPASPAPLAAGLPYDPPAPGTWQLVFDDEFGGAHLNPASWHVYDGPGNGGHGLRRPSAVALNGRGQLVITARMIGGLIVSGGLAARLNQTYGYFEARVRTEPDPTRNLSGEVLTWPESGKWPLDGENDIYETQSGGGHRPFRTFIHYGADNQQSYFTHDANGSQWHVVGMEWDPTQITIYRDGVPVWKLDDPGAIARVPHHLCIQLDATSDRPLTGAVRMYVDYVRIWRSIPGPTPA
jgi:beta-glucanase (GH16 family)